MSSAKHTEAGGLLVKAETTYNTDPTPTTSANAVRFIKPRPEFTTRFAYDGARGLQNGAWGQLQRQTPAGRNVSWSGRFEPKGRGAAYTSSSVKVPDVHDLLTSCGFTATVTTTGGSEKWDFTPDTGTATPTSVTAWAYGRGELWKVNGMYNNLKITADGPGVPVWEFSGVGTMATDPADIALPSLTYTVPTVLPPLAVGASFTFGNFTGGIIRSFNFDLGRTVDQPRVNQNAATGHAGFQFGPRDPVLECVVEATSLQGTPFHATSAIDPYNLIEAATGLAFTVTVGSTQYNRWKLIFGQAQAVEAEPVDEGNAALWRLRIKPYVTGDQAVDDITLRFD